MLPYSRPSCIEILETGISDKLMVYVEIDGNMDILDRLFRKKPPVAIYYDNKGIKFAFHWLLHPITVGKLFPGQPVTKMPPE